MKLARFLIAASMCGAGWAQTPERFDSVTITRGKDGPDARPQINILHDRVIVQDQTLKRLIMAAYELPPSMIRGGPGWMDSARFDIQAVADERLSAQELRLLLRRLLAERFELVMHPTTKELNARVLEVADGGPKFDEKDKRPWNLEEPEKPGKGKSAMDQFALTLAMETNMPVLNGTAIEGRFPLSFHYLAETVDADLKKQLGLRLRRVKMPLEVLTIDHAERPKVH